MAEVEVSIPSLQLQEPFFIIILTLYGHLKDYFYLAEAWEIGIDLAVWALR